MLIPKYNFPPCPHCEIFACVRRKNACKTLSNEIPFRFRNLFQTSNDMESVESFISVSYVLQDCPNGRLTPAKFVDMYKMFFPSGNAEEFCDHVFRTFDMDKNGYIDFKEFLLAIDVTSSGTPEEKLKWAFRMYDVDGNGVIDIQEMTKIVQAIYDMLGACSSNRPADSAEERARNIFAKMDENNDGQLTQDEFLKGCLQDEELSKMLAP